MRMSWLRLMSSTTLNRYWLGIQSRYQGLRELLPESAINSMSSEDMGLTASRMDFCNTIYLRLSHICTLRQIRSGRRALLRWLQNTSTDLYFNKRRQYEF